MAKYCCVVLLVMCILSVNIGNCRRIPTSNDLNSSEYVWHYKTEAQKYYEKVPEDSKCIEVELRICS